LPVFIVYACTSIEQGGKTSGSSEESRSVTPEKWDKDRGKRRRQGGKMESVYTAFFKKPAALEKFSLEPPS
jgi:hypothetical protein